MIYLEILPFSSSDKLTIKRKINGFLTSSDVKIRRIGEKAICDMIILRFLNYFGLTTP
jgi:hypothetical protein